jgi:hypothetical protein
VTAHQQTKLNELAQEFRSVGVREDSETRSVFLDCFDVSLPEACVRCGDDSDHLSAHFDHSFVVAVPVKTYRVSPSGFRQDITPVESAA